MFQPNRKLKLWIQTDHWPLFEKEGKHSSRTPEILAWSLMLLFILCVTETLGWLCGVSDSVFLAVVTTMLSLENH